MKPGGLDKGGPGARGPQAPPGDVGNGNQGEGWGRNPSGCEWERRTVQLLPEIWRLLRKLRITVGAAVPLLGIYPKK